MTSEAVAAGSSAAAAFFAALAAWASLVAIRRGALAEKRAAVVVTVEYEGGNSRVVVFNKGPATARNVHVEVEGPAATTPDSARKNLSPPFVLDDFPVRSMPAGSRHRCPIVLAMGQPIVWEVGAQWTDDTGDRSESYSLSFS